MLRTLSMLFVSLASSVALAGPPAAAGALEVDDVVAMTSEERATLLQAWRSEAQRRLAVLPVEVADPGRACLVDRRAEAARLLDVLDAVSIVFGDGSASTARKETAVAVALRAWAPVASVEPHTPCSARSLDEGVVDVDILESSGSDLFDPVADDPMTLGPDLGDRRALRL